MHILLMPHSMRLHREKFPTPRLLTRELTHPLVDRLAVNFDALLILEDARTPRHIAAPVRRFSKLLVHRPLVPEHVFAHAEYLRAAGRGALKNPVLQYRLLRRQSILCLGGGRQAPRTGRGSGRVRGDLRSAQGRPVAQDAAVAQGGGRIDGEGWGG